MHAPALTAILDRPLWLDRSPASAHCSSHSRPACLCAASTAAASGGGRMKWRLFSRLAGSVFIEACWRTIVMLLLQQPGSLRAPCSRKASQSAWCRRQGCAPAAAAACQVPAWCHVSTLHSVEVLAVAVCDAGAIACQECARDSAGQAHGGQQPAAIGMRMPQLPHAPHLRRLYRLWPLSLVVQLCWRKQLAAGGVNQQRRGRRAIKCHRCHT